MELTQRVLFKFQPSLGQNNAGEVAVEEMARTGFKKQILDQFG